METIWQEEVKCFSSAYDLICIVDQIHDYAINHHRPFVIKHLEAWHARHQRLIESAEIPVGGSSAQESEAMILDGSNSEDGRSNALRTAANKNDWNQAPEVAEWYRLKQRSKDIKDAKTKDSRKRRRMEAEAEADVDMLAAEPSGGETATASMPTTEQTEQPLSEYSITKAKAKRWLESME